MVLGKSGHFGPACSLFEMAFEETGKAVIFRLCADGFGRIESTRGGSQVVLSLPWKTATAQLGKHATKREIPIWLQLFHGLVPAFVGILSYFANHTFPAETRELGAGSPITAVRLASGEEHSPPTPEDFEELDRMDAATREESELVLGFGSLRNAGLYVDYDGVTIHGPSEILESKYKLAERVVRGYLDLTDHALERGIVNGTFQAVVESVQETRRLNPP
jgi:hypothetical protein